MVSIFVFILLLMKELLKTIVIDQGGYCWKDEFIKREIQPKYIDSEEIIVISGIRRCGKSTLLHQIRNELPQKDYYLNFDDERLIEFKVENFQELLETFIILFGEQDVFYFDEIQNIKGWERFVRRLHDLGKKVFVTGSNASMLSRELGTHLTGRYLSIELFPFSFKEFVLYNGLLLDEKELYSTSGKSILQKHFNEYLKSGGFPLYIKNKNDDYLKSLYNSIIYRDVMVRNRLTYERELLELVYFLASNVAKPSSNNSLAKTVHIKNATTIKNYISFLQNTYLLFQINKHDYSLKKQLQNLKKTYFIDNGLVNKLGFMFSDNLGRLLENLVFVELKRKGFDVYYHKEKHECDFVVKETNKITNAIQVCFAFESEQTKRREINGLLEALNKYNIEEGIILTNSIEDEIVTNEKKIKIKATWKWLLE
jgi:predicted AAA+ superfamily ATPase